MDDAKYFKNRKWVIKAGIAFLVIMGLLTFFSNTIMNYSLPQVRAQNPTQGSISESIKGSGTVVANKQAKVVSSDTRLIDQVNENSEPITITGQRGNAVLVGESDWLAIQETLFLESVPGFTESVRQAGAEGVQEGSSVIGW